MTFEPYLKGKELRKKIKKLEREWRATNKVKFPSPKVIKTTVIEEPSYKEKYHNFLASPFWKEKRHKILRKNQSRCFICHTQKELNVHHISYENVFGAKPEKSGNVVLLCRKHHEEFHKRYGVKKVMIKEWNEFIQTVNNST